MSIKNLITKKSIKKRQKNVNKKKYSKKYEKKNDFNQTKMILVQKMDLDALVGCRGRDLTK